MFSVHMMDCGLRSNVGVESANSFLGIPTASARFQTQCAVDKKRTNTYGSNDVRTINAAEGNLHKRLKTLTRFGQAGNIAASVLSLAISPDCRGGVSEPKLAASIRPPVSPTGQERSPPICAAPIAQLPNRTVRSRNYRRTNNIGITAALAGCEDGAGVVRITSSDIPAHAYLSFTPLPGKVFPSRKSRLINNLGQPTALERSHHENDTDGIVSPNNEGPNGSVSEDGAALHHQLGGVSGSIVELSKVEPKTKSKRRPAPIAPDPLTPLQRKILRTRRSRLPKNTTAARAMPGDCVGETEAGTSSNTEVPNNFVDANGPGLPRSLKGGGKKRKSSAHMSAYAPDAPPLKAPKVNRSKHARKTPMPAVTKPLPHGHLASCVGQKKRKTSACMGATAPAVPPLKAPNVNLSKHGRKSCPIEPAPQSESPTRPQFHRLQDIPTSTWELPEQPDCRYCGAVRFAREPPGFCCASGKVAVDVPKIHPRLWDLFVHDITPIGVEFRKRCRSYNNTLAFTSIGFECDGEKVKNDKGVYTLRVQGAMRHYIKNLIPKEGLARHAQLYFYGSENEMSNRLAQARDLQMPILKLLLEIMEVNPYHNFFLRAKEVPCLGSKTILLRGDPVLDKNVYNLPVVDHVAAIWSEDGGDVEKQPRDVRVYLKKGGSAQISYYYGCYDPLRYPLLFPFGEPGWHMGLQKRESPKSVSLDHRGLLDCLDDPTAASSVTEFLESERSNLSRRRGGRSNISLREYYAYIFQIRRNDETSVLRTGRLAQQYMIDMYIKVESQRLDFLRKQQRENKSAKRGDTLQGVADSVRSNKKSKGFDVGKRIKLNTSFIGGPRDLRKRYMNALALVTEYGPPDYFITMTCNPKWKEIQKELLANEDVCNRADLYARVFRAKNEELKEELIVNNLLGEVAAYFYAIEFQKRGLPHVHWLLIMKPAFKVTSSTGYDTFVSAELPDPSDNRHLYDCVVRHMMHGPCGELKTDNVCMIGGSCKDKYPKEFCEMTQHRQDAYPAYRRRQNGRVVRVRGSDLDNRWVVPHNPYLLAKFDCHINVEVCSNIKSVKYLYKYVCKGNDQIAYNVVDEEANQIIDEIANFQTARWVCAPEAMWRIYGFDLFAMHPPVQQLHVHLPGYQWINFNDDEDLETVVGAETTNATQLTEFFKMNEDENVKALNLLYRDFPKYFVWNDKQHVWTRRQRAVAVGRMVTVHVMDPERYYLRLLLNHVRAPTSYEELRSYENKDCGTFREAALKRGLLKSDGDLQKAMEEASGYKMPYALRRFFCIILVNNSPASPSTLWTNFKDDLSSDFLRACNNDVEKAHIQALQNIDTILHSMGQEIDKYRLVPFDVGLTREEIFHREYENERNTEVDEDDLNSVALLNTKQRTFYEEIMQSVRTDGGISFFVDGPGGTGKTFLYKALLATVRSTGGIALAVASSGVAASLLPNGRTAHSRFKLPLNIDESQTCGVRKNTGEARLIITAKLIIWDEASMANRKHIEALDNLLRDLMGVDILFGGKTVVFGGDFRQTIPIVSKGSREASINACLVNSCLWPYIKKLRLTDNMRAMEDPDFVDRLMRIGEGTEPCVKSDYIRLPADMCLPYFPEGEPLEALIAEIFPSFDMYQEAPTAAINRAILTPKNSCMESINALMIERFPGRVKEYISSNVANNPSQQGFYQDYLDGINVGALPPHVLQLKPNCPIMLIRNINPIEGMCNGTRLIVRETGDRIIVATIASGELAGKVVLIPRVTLEFTDLTKCPVPFKRYQFPVRVCFSMSINKAQGQTLDRVGIYLPAPVFAHGQFYVGVSRVRRSSAVKLLIKPTTGDTGTEVDTRNVVYQEVLDAAH